MLAGGFALVTMLMAANGSPVAFKPQIAAQAIILFGFLLALLSSGHASAKTAQVYNDQQQKMAGKADIRFALQDLLTAAEDNNTVPRDIVTRLRALQNDSRFISPNASPQPPRPTSRCSPTATPFRQHSPTTRSTGSMPPSSQANSNATSAAAARSDITHYTHHTPTTL